MGPQLLFLALKIIFVTMLRWDSKTDFDQYIAKKNILHNYIVQYYNIPEKQYKNVLHTLFPPK